MARSPQGPLKEWAGLTLGTIQCDHCPRTVAVKVNKSGWPYAICPHCNEKRTQSIGAAISMIEDVTHWENGLKKRVFAALELETPTPQAAPAISEKPKEERQREKLWFEL